MGWTLEKKNLVKEQRRSQIIEAALYVFSAKGFFKAKISDISKYAGIAKGLIYKYFDSKEDILRQLIVEIVKTYMNFLPSKSPDQFTYKDLQQVLLNFFYHVKENKEKWALLYSVITQPAIADLYKDAIEEDFAKVRQYFVQFFKKQSCEAELCFYYMLSTIEGLIFNFLTIPDLDIENLIFLLINSLEQNTYKPQNKKEQ